MPITRSASRQLSTITKAAIHLTAATPAKAKRKANSESDPPQQSKKSRLEVPSEGAPERAPVARNDQTPTVFLPATLSFSFDEAKRHLVNADARFDDLFKKMKCRPFEHLESVDPFRTLVTSILGQQISWLAARSIKHKFIRLYDPSLPEKPGSVESDAFPTARQVSSTEVTTLKSAGLSTRKAEYVQDLAARFADGRLSATKILDANDEELAEMLIEVRGIGRWTVDMFAMFSLRRPDILPVGDLGVQRGMLRWFLSLHSPKHSFSVSPKKLPKAPSEEAGPERGKGLSQGAAGDAGTSGSEIAVSPADASSVPPAPLLPSTPKKGGQQSEDVNGSAVTSLPALPTPFTPSINKTLNKTLPDQKLPLPAGLSIDALKSRLDGKKKIKGAFLTPKEMEDLTESWRPYRSLGVYYMWALAEEKAE